MGGLLERNRVAEGRLPLSLPAPIVPQVIPAYRSGSVVGRLSSPPRSGLVQPLYDPLCLNKNTADDHA